MRGQFTDQQPVTIKMRLQSTKPAMIVLPFFVVAYAWMCEKHVNIAGPVVVLFFSGFCAMYVMRSNVHLGMFTLTYFQL
jgi:hypothetical protein